MTAPRHPVRATAVRRPCAVCGQPKAVRESDGRIREHQFEGTECAGSNQAPARKAWL